MRALLEVKPAEVADKQVRARIAKGYRHVAFETQQHSAEAVDGLILWGGKFSAPLLLELLDSPTAGDDAPVYVGLAELATPETATAVAARLKSGKAEPDEALACLEKMGPLAETAVVGLLPFESADSNLAGIEVLGKIGSKKSTAILRKAAKSENAEVKEAALAALRAIRDRGRKDK